MFTYSQTSGQFSSDSGLSAIGYSGNGAGLNNPAMQSVRMHGPLPQGKYAISPPSVHPKLGPVAMELMPYPDNEMFMRAGFFIHGDNAALDHTASDGCIILPHATRLLIATAVLAGDNQLEVTE